MLYILLTIFPGNYKIMEINLEFEKRKPWITKFEIQGKTYGGNFDAMNDARVAQFFEQLPNVKTVLELGSLEGGHSFALAKNDQVTSVKAIEIRPANIEKAKFVQNLLGDTKVDFIEADLEKVKLTDFGQFDAVFCSGLLYHLPKPWELLEQFKDISPNVFIWTQYADEKSAKKVVNGYRGKWYREGSWLDPLSGRSRYSFWLSLGSLMQILTESDFKQTFIIENNLTHQNGWAITLASSANNFGK